MENNFFFSFLRKLQDFPGGSVTKDSTKQCGKESLILVHKYPREAGPARPATEPTCSTWESQLLCPRAAATAAHVPWGLRLGNRSLQGKACAPQPESSNRRCKPAQQRRLTTVRNKYILCFFLKKGKSFSHRVNWGSEREVAAWGKYIFLNKVGPEFNLCSFKKMWRSREEEESTGSHFPTGWLTN